MTNEGRRILESFTARERQIAVLFIETAGRNKELGAQLGISEQVVKNYLRNIYLKTGVCDRISLALKLIRHGVVACPCGANGARVEQPAEVSVGSRN